jgi:hypothetical protein
MTDPSQRTDTVARFLFKGASKDEDRPARGLFVIWQEKPVSGSVDPSDFELGVCDYNGVLRIYVPGTNPWSVALESIAQRQKVLTQQFRSVLLVPRSYLMCFVAHPSPGARRLRCRFRRHSRRGLGHWHDKRQPASSPARG